MLTTSSLPKNFYGEAQQMFNKQYPTLKDYEYAGQTVFVRVDFNVPMRNGIVTDQTRIVAALPTIKYLIQHNAKIVLMSHLGRVKEESDLQTKTLAPVKGILGNLLDNKDCVQFVDDIEGADLEAAINNLQTGQVLLMENTRFADITNYDGSINLQSQRESKNDKKLGLYWSTLADIFVNDAFGTIHRAHASNVGIAKHMVKKCLGLLVVKELTMLSKITTNPARPLVSIVGGAKVSDKIQILDKLCQISEAVIIGGAMTYTFWKADGLNTGASRVEANFVDQARLFLDQYRDKIFLASDCVATTTFEDKPGIVKTPANLKDDEMGLDIGPASQAKFKDIIKKARTVFWNGPMGVFEFGNYAAGTRAICENVKTLNEAFTVIGGGDSAAAAEAFGYTDCFSHISTGGGASLDFIAGLQLPGLQAIIKKNHK